MAYGVKYRIEFKDTESVDIKIDILEEGFASAVTSLTPTSDPLTIEWPSVRGDIFNPVRGAQARISFYATSVGQFNEFFSANTLQYKVIVYYNSSPYWSGFPILSDYSESLMPAPYPVTISAYDLGFLQNKKWDISLHGDDKIIDIIQLALVGTTLALSLKERIAVREDSMSQLTSVSTLSLADIHQASLIDESTWLGLSMYEVLTRVLLPFNAFVMQENNMWNVCRVADMRVDHYYRTFNISGSVTGSGSEDSTVNLSDYFQLNTNSVLLSSPNYSDLNVTQNDGLVNLVNNGIAQNRGPDPLDYWNRNSGSGGIDFVSTSTSHGIPTVGYTQAKLIELDSLVSRSTFEHETTYAVQDGTSFDVSYYYEIHSNTGTPATATKVTIEIELDDGAGTVNYVNMTTGAWSTTASVADVTFSSASDVYGGTTSFTTDKTPTAGTLTIRLLDANWSNFTFGGNTYYTLSIKPRVINNSGRSGLRDFTETIDASSVEESNEIVFYYGDPADTDSKDILLGSLTITADGSATNAWKSLNGSVTDTLVDLAVDCYQAQYQTPARRIQAQLKGSLNYLDVLTDSSNRKYLASKITRDFSDSTLDGEWIEIKVGWGDDLLGTFTNGSPSGGDSYDTFATSANQVDVIKTNGAKVERATLDTTSVTAGTRYRIRATVVDNEVSPGVASDLPDFDFGGTTKTDLAVGLNEWEVIADTTESTHNGILESASADLCSIEIAVFIDEAIGV